MTLSDGFCVDRHREEFLNLIRSGIGILFANENEIKALYETESFDEAAAKAASDTKLAVLTRSEKGSLILSEGETLTIPRDHMSYADDVARAAAIREEACNCAREVSLI